MTKQENTEIIQSQGWEKEKKKKKAVSLTQGELYHDEPVTVKMFLLELEDGRGSHRVS